MSNRAYSIEPRANAEYRRHDDKLDTHITYDGTGGVTVLLACRHEDSRRILEALQQYEMVEGR